MKNEEEFSPNDFFLEGIENEKFNEEELSFINDFEEKEYFEDSISINLDLISEKKQRKKLNKEDLKTIPLPIFNCFYCANEKIAFQKLINDNLSQKYLFCSSKNDLNIINGLINFNIKNLNDNKTNKNHSIENYFICLLKDEIIKSSEYLKKYYNKSQLFLKEILLNNNFSMKKEKINIEKEKNNNSIFFNDINLKDFKRKIKWEDISFEEENFNIWDTSNLSEIKNENYSYENIKKHFMKNSEKINISFSYNEINSSTSTSNQSNKPFKNTNFNFSFSFVQH